MVSNSHQSSTRRYRSNLVCFGFDEPGNYGSTLRDTTTSQELRSGYDSFSNNEANAGADMKNYSRFGNPFTGPRPGPMFFRDYSSPMFSQASRPSAPPTPRPLIANAPFFGRANSRQVQQNAALELNLAQTMSRKLLYIYIAWSILELAGACFVLFWSWEKPCNQPLQLWAGVYSARLLYYLPQYFKRLQGIPETSEDIRRKNWISLLQFAWFIMGQSWFFEANSCRATAPVLYYWTMAMVICAYLVMLAPLLLLLGICFCLPCVLLFLRLVTPNPGAQEEEIVQLPEREFDPQRYERGVPNEEVHAHARERALEEAREEFEMVPSPPRSEPETPSAPPLSAVPESPSAPAPPPRASAPAPHHPTPEEEAPSCAICMEDFQAGDRLRGLPCKHDFHKECVDRWLAVNSTCPLCRASIFRQPNTPASVR